MCYRSRGRACMEQSCACAHVGVCTDCPAWCPGDSQSASGCCMSRDKPWLSGVRSCAAAGPAWPCARRRRRGQERAAAVRALHARGAALEPRRAHRQLLPGAAGAARPPEDRQCRVLAGGSRAALGACAVHSGPFHPGKGARLCEGPARVHGCAARKAWLPNARVKSASSA